MTEIKETKEVIVGYKAIDGTIFKCEEECKKYEESAEHTIKAAFMSHVIKETNQQAIMDEGYEDSDAWIININDEVALNDVNHFIEYNWSTHGKYNKLDHMFITNDYIGKTIILFVNYDYDYFWNKGTIDDVLDNIRKCYNNLVEPKEE